MPSSPALQVVVVDDHPIVRRGLVEVIDDEPGLHVCGEAAHMEEARRVVDATRPHVVVIDLVLGDENGLELVAELLRDHPGLHILVLSSHDERLYADRALKAGALGYIMKEAATSELLTAIRRVGAGKSYLSAETAERILVSMGSSGRPGAQVPSDRLSDRERHVLTLIGRGLSTRQIAEQLELSIKTVESHCAHIKEKLGLQSGRDLMRVAVTLSEGERMSR